MEDKRQLSAGNHIGKIDDYGVYKNDKTGKVSAYIKFKIDKGPGEGYAELTWFGGLSNQKSETAKNPPVVNTVKVLLDCGFTGSDPSDLASGPGNEVLKIGTEMSLVIEDKETDGSLFSQIKWVNTLGGGMKRATKEDLGTVDTSAFRAALLKAKENRPSGEEDIPF